MKHIALVFDIIDEEVQKSVEEYSPFKSIRCDDKIVIIFDNEASHVEANKVKDRIYDDLHILGDVEFVEYVDGMYRLNSIPLGIDINKPLSEM